MHPNFICPYIYILKIKIINKFQKISCIKKNTKERQNKTKIIIVVA